MTTHPAPHQKRMTGPAHEALPARRRARGHDALGLRAGICLSPRLAQLLAPEWRQVELRPGTELDAAALDLVLLEVQHGSVPGWGRHQGRLEGAVRRWSAQGLPVVVWCTRGSPEQLRWIGEVTAVAVASAREHERALHGGDPVLWMPAAAQPRRHRPAANFSGRRGAVTVVDGLADLEDDSPLADVLAPALGPLAAGDLRVVRVQGKSSWVRLPPSLAERAASPTAWEDLEDSLGQARVAVDLSGSSAAASWTSVALASSAVALVGTTTLQGDLPGELEELVPRRARAAELRSEVVARVHQEELAAREGHRARRAVLTGHTAAHRVRSIAQAAGVAAPQPGRSVSAVVPTNRVHQIDTVLENLARQSHPEVELVLVLHGLDLGADRIHARATALGLDHLVVVHADASLTLGACMNRGIDASSGRYIAKMDDDNYYGEHYLTDLVLAFGSTSAGIVGKWCHYVWLRSSDAVVLRYPDAEHSLERRIQGGSMLFDGDVVRDLRFGDLPRAVDSDILDRAVAHEVEIYSADRFNFVSIRGADPHAHTWTVADSTFMTRTGRLMFYGDPRAHVSV
ncbi:MAG: glycosyltransferase [Ornithinimicrobium sp.]